MTARMNLRTVSTATANRQDFDCNNTLTGRHWYFGTGYLPDLYVDRLAADQTADDFFVVMSYRTPIAWYAHGAWHVPNVKYSPTTSRHLSSLRLPVRVTGSGEPWAIAA